MLSTCLILVKLPSVHVASSAYHSQPLLSVRCSYLSDMICLYLTRTCTCTCMWQNRFHDNSSTDISSMTLRLQTFHLQTFRLLLYTSDKHSYTSNFCFRKSLFSSIPTYI